MNNRPILAWVVTDAKTPNWVTVSSYCFEAAAEQAVLKYDEENGNKLASSDAVVQVLVRDPNNHSAPSDVAILYEVTCGKRAYYVANVAENSSVRLGI